MRAELEKKLITSFPNLYRDYYSDMSATCMCWGFECGDGWYDLIYELSAQLEEEIKLIEKTETKSIFYWPKKLWNSYLSKSRILRKYRHSLKFSPEIYLPAASQVKEKFGDLRFYIDFETDKISELISVAEEKSRNTCEVCGAPGGLGHVGHWYLTRCAKCAGPNFKSLAEEDKE